MHPARFGDAVDRVRAVRLTATSTDRSDEWRATLRLASGHLPAGIGPGHFNLDYRSSAGFTVTEKYAHNEYLQFLAEEGVIGVAILVSGLGFLAVALVRALLTGRQAAAGALSALTALLVHSAFDFLWHIPAVVLLPMALVCLPLAGSA
jgi:O-antigen ligase